MVRLFLKIVSPRAARLAALAACLMAAAVTAAPARAEVLRLTTLNWPPYTGIGLPRLGTMTAVVSGAAARAGDRMELRILPWKRAVRTGEEAPGFIGYFPVYWTEERATRRCHLSAPIGSSRLGLAEPVDAPVVWTQVADLSAYTVGTVEGYANTAEFDKLAADGILHVNAAVDDVTNLRKVVAGRLDAAVVDRDVMAFLMATDTELRPHRAAVRFSRHLLEVKDLHVCFRRTPEGAAARDRFNRGLDRLDTRQTVEEVMERVRLLTTDWLADAQQKP